MNDLLLIKLVKANPCLYNPTNPGYLDNDLKVAIWDTIGLEMKSDGTSSKARWINLRNVYRRYLKENSSTAKEMKVYKYADELSFLNEFFIKMNNTQSQSGGQLKRENLGDDTDEHENENMGDYTGEPLHIQTPYALRNDLHLIQLVKNHSILYDASLPEYMDNNLKIDIWNKIGQELKTDGISCKHRWKNIRTAYCKSLKCRHGTYGEKAKNASLYKYHKQLRFLKKCMHSKFGQRSHWGVDDVEEGEDIDMDDDGLDDNETEENSVDYEEEESKVFAEELHHDPFQIESFHSLKTPSEDSREMTPGKSQKMNKVPQQTASFEPVEHLTNKNKQQAGLALPQHVDAFLGGIAPTLKTFTPYYLNLAKSEIFASVQKFEMQMLLNQQQSSEGRPEPSTSVSSPSTLPSP